MKKKPLIIVGAVLVALLAVYLGFTAYFSKHYLFRTTIGSVECGGRTPQYAIDRTSEITSDYLLAVKDRLGNTFAFAGTDVDYSYVPTGEEENILKKQNAFSWIASIFRDSTYSLPTSITYDESKMDTAVQNLGIFDEDYINVPVDAAFQVTDDGCEIVPEEIGNQPIFEEVKSQVKKALDFEIEEITLTDASYVEPKIYQDNAELTAVVDTINTYMASEITYEIGDNTEQLTTKDIKDLLIVDQENFAVTIDEDKLLDFVQGLCTKYNTYADVRNFTTTRGDTIQIGGGDYGWVINKANEMEQIKTDLAGGVPVTREPVYEQTAAQYGADDIGNTYIEIDYTNQHLWYYESGSLKYDTAIVSGNLSSQNGSVDGVYSISYKQKDATLVGEDYSSSVKYFMPFAYNIGIHDASWRSEFGGDIYKTGGSHGCINVPAAAAEALFGMVKVDTPVVAYYREEVELTNNAARISNAYSYVEPEEDETKQ